MPAFLTDHELDAIRKGRIFIGMSEKALYMPMGFPTKTNEAVVLGSGVKTRHQG